MQYYRTQEGDVLDALITRAYGSCDDDKLAALYAANPGLCEYGPIFPAGLTLALPDTLPSPSLDQKRGVSLWD